jgi:putative restriction endonuclease
MAKAVLTTKVEPTYDDLPEFRYHFPRTYLRQIEAAVGDWIVYYEPRRTSGDLSSSGGRQAYFATAKVDSITPDPNDPDRFYANVSGYLGFRDPVPFRNGDFCYESGLQRDDGETNKGAFGRAVRNVPDHEYDLIMRAGFAEIIKPRESATVTLPGLAEEQAEFERPIVERLVARPFRKAAFSSTVKGAYENTCAITGLKIINGGGRPEVQAAHIKPVASSGPDSVRNGLALSSTVHWMFDRGLISLGEDYSILLAKDRVPEPIQGLINPDLKLRLPARPEFRPHPQFLEYHRENVFKG